MLVARGDSDFVLVNKQVRSERMLLVRPVNSNNLLVTVVVEAWRVAACDYRRICLAALELKLSNSLPLPGFPAPPATRTNQTAVEKLGKRGLPLGG